MIPLVKWMTACATALAAAVVCSMAAADCAAPQLPAPRVFAPDIVYDNSSSPTFSPNGDTLLYAHSGAKYGTIFESHFASGAWSKPAAVSFSGKWDDGDPVFSPGGSYVIFSSTRPINGKIQPKPQLWRVARTQSGWGEPSPLPATVNDGAFLVAPSVANDGTVYYLHIANHVHRIYRARLQSGTYLPPETLVFDDAQAQDYDPSIAPDQSFLIFASARRDHATDAKPHLFAVFDKNGSWGRAVRIHYTGETSSDDAGPILGRDGNTLYFTSDRGGHVNAWALPIGEWLKALAE